MVELTQDIVKELLHYDPETGLLYWKERDVKWFKDGKKPAIEECKRWNARYSNKEAITGNRVGYRQGTVLSVHVQAHRLIWLWMTGEWPDFIDHENGDRGDNRWCNLRNVTKRENSRNKKKMVGASSQYIGVTFYKGKWLAQINAGFGNERLGLFALEYDAHLAYKARADELGFHKNHGRRNEVV